MQEAFLSRDDRESTQKNLSIGGNHEKKGFVKQRAAPYPSAGDASRTNRISYSAMGPDRCTVMGLFVVYDFFLYRYISDAATAGCGDSDAGKRMHSVVAVSYTHLDVYKRQEYNTSYILQQRGTYANVLLCI